MFIIEMLLLLNTEDGQYRIYNTIENWKKFQSQTSMLPKIIFNIFPHPRFNQKNTILYFIFDNCH